MSTQQKPQQFTKFGETFVSYGSYHHNIVNKIIHIICIPIITATFLALLTYIPLHFEVAGYSIGAAHIGVAIALIYYLTISIGAFVIMSIVFGIGAYLWILAFKDFQPNQMRNAIIILNVGAWILQFIGHGVFQKRKPALLDNIFQILSAPLFVVIELFDLIGIRTSEIANWKKQIEVNVKEFREKKTSIKTQ